MKKIMFNDKYGLTQAVLQGRKTMTRRIVTNYEFNQWDGRQIMLGYDPESNTQEYGLLSDDGSGEVVKKRLLKYPYRCGEVLAVAQSYKDLGYTKEWVELHIKPNPNAKPADPFEKKYPGWSNKMFTHSELSKALRIRITDIKVERLQDISEEDCTKEGILTLFTGYCYEYNDKHGFGYRGFSHIKEAFVSLIDGVSGKGTWERNPFVFAYTFKLIK